MPPALVFFDGVPHAPLLLAAEDDRGVDNDRVMVMGCGGS